MTNVLALLSLLIFLCAGFSVTALAALPGLRLELASPRDWQVVQRSTRTAGELIVAGALTPLSRDVPLPDKVEARVTGTSAFGAVPAQWQPLPWDPRAGAFRGALQVPAGGWYRLEVRARRDGAPLATVVVDHVGLGEVFVIAGQSNAANYGEERQYTESGLVSAFDGTTWRLANDPQPGAGGSKGSFLPPFGDELAERFHVPIGLADTAVGSTSVREWLPPGTCLSRLPPLTRNVVTNRQGQWEASGKLFQNLTARMRQLGINGFRAVLWHQGESDAHQADPERTLPGPQYRQYLEQLICDSRAAIGWDAPWFVAQVSYHNPHDTGSAEIRSAQQSLWQAGLALPGPDSDKLTGGLRENHGAGVHFSGEGLRAHAHLWVESISPWLEPQLSHSAEAR